MSSISYIATAIAIVDFALQSTVSMKTWLFRKLSQVLETTVVGFGCVQICGIGDGFRSHCSKVLDNVTAKFQCSIASPTDPSHASSTRNAPSSRKRSRSLPEKTPDEHYIMVNGRRWRATDPLIPEACRTELKHFLAKGRSGVRGQKTAEQIAGNSPVFGERSKLEWWNDTEKGRRERWEGALRELRELDASK
ncbi:hypothetical protein QBC46DRAFT_411203 [Diplogelasinospora grovesii]|uniref:Uncharacterized protein n=1 Tax=Diplogelasinospora grovesii TaxID=303347 RepID=A0AAN6S1U1_9PEZI|nr:hypothetical protein QBC46DRAFT_411203 [Diplogelasinospora grovesii]